LNGLNAGVFFLRVNEWSIHFIAGALALPTHRPDVKLRYAEQTALRLLTREERWKNGTMHVPQRWFNAYHNYGNDSIPQKWKWKYGRDNSIPDEWNWKNCFIGPGDLLVHLPGSFDCRNGLINNYPSKIRDHRATYVVPLNETYYEREVEQFWSQDAPHEEENQVIFGMRFHVLQEVRRKAENAEIEAVKRCREILAKTGALTDVLVEQAIKEVRNVQKQLKVEALRVEYAARLNGARKDCTHAI
jgi:hypothetical protein